MLWHVVVAKESDVTERIIRTGGEQIQGNETRHFRDRGPRIGEKKGEGWASWTAKDLFAWIRTHDEPRKSEMCGYIAASLLRAALTCLLCTALTCYPGSTRLRGSGLLAPRHRMATVDCSMPVPCICALREKENFQLFHFVQPLKMVHSSCQFQPQLPTPLAAEIGPSLLRT